MVNRTQTVFQYKTNKGVLHKMPALLKLILIIPFSVFCLPLPSHWLSAGILTAFIAASSCGFSLHEQLTDLKPAAFYALVMYGLSVLSSLFSPPLELPAVLIPRPEFLRISLRLVLIVQISAMMFRTTSSMEIRESLGAIERAARRLLSCLPFLGRRISLKPVFSTAISLFLSFIPQIFETWSNINLAWRARGGRQGFIKIKIIIFILISHGFEKAALRAKALEARGK